VHANELVKGAIEPLSEGAVGATDATVRGEDDHRVDDSVEGLFPLVLGLGQRARECRQRVLAIRRRYEQGNRWGGGSSARSDRRGESCRLGRRHQGDSQVAARVREVGRARRSEHLYVVSRGDLGPMLDGGPWPKDLDASRPTTHTLTHVVV